MEEQQEQETSKLNEGENDETKVEFVSKKPEKKKDKKKEKKASLLRAMAYQFGPQFLVGMLLKVIYDTIQFLQPQLMK